jgi:hypothetical protein
MWRGDSLYIVMLLKAACVDAIVVKFKHCVKSSAADAGST